MRDCLHGCNERIIEKNVSKEEIIVIVGISG
jgi:hypothetical protein